MPNWKKIIVSGSDASLSSAYIEGNLTASAAYLTSASIGHLETIYETASVIYSSGSTKFGDTSDDTHEITGSLLVTGSISIVEGGSLTGTASIADLATTASQADNATTASHVVTASFADSATTASHALNVPDTASHALTAVTSSHTAGTASFANNATTSSYTLTGDGVFSGSFSGSFQGDASELNVNPFPFTGSGEMQGKLTVESFQDYVDEDYVEQYFAGTAIASSGDIALTGSIFSPYINANSFTGSLLGTASYAVTASHVIGGGGGDTATSASLAETASFYGGSVISASFAETASFYGGSVTSASLAETASFVETAQTASYMTTGSFKQPVQFVKTEPATASLYHLHIMSASSAITMSLPSGSPGDWFKVSNMRTGSLLESFGSQNIMSASGDLTLDKANAGFELIYTDNINGWVIIGQ